MKKIILIFAFIMASFVVFSQNNNAVEVENFANNYKQQKDLLEQKTINEKRLREAKRIEELLQSQIPKQSYNVKANTQDSLALVALYDSTNGANWTHTWDLNQPVSTWYHITLNSSGRVISISLDRNQLTGSIPSEIGNLDSLERLSLFWNNISGSIPAEICNLDSLKFLYLSFNQLSGSIPTGIGNLTNLQELDLYSNQLSGSIPTGIGNLTNLQELHLGFNQLTGTIPIGITNLTNLTNLSIENNQLTGTIPTGIDNLTNLRYFNLSHNQLTGSIPTGISNLTNLINLSLNNNQLTGSIPTEIGNLTNLQYLNLSYNQLTGTIPTGIGNLTNLQRLNLNQNQLTGSIPTGIGNLTNLQWLILDNNILTDSIPTGIGNLTNLILLYLDHNNLIGSIPPTIGNLHNLERLDLDNNSLSGSIPDEIDSLSNLIWLFIAFNNLTGSIPTGICNLHNLQRIALNNNNLTGSIPDEIDSLSNLDLIYLQDNQLSGVIPSGIGNLSNLQTLYLNNNQLSGAIPEAIDSLSNLQNFSLYNNNFVDLPDLSSLPSLYYLSVSNNKFTFEDIEPNISISNFYYWPQAKVGSVQYYSPNIGDNLTLSVSVGGTANTYQWYKDSVQISSATDSFYTISNYDPSVDSAVYYCKINNTIATQLTLQSQNIYVGYPIPQYQISASVNPANSGTISGDSTYDYGSTATLIATPNTGYHFVNWTQNGNEVSTNPEFSFTVTQDSSFVANFEIDTYTIFVSVNPANSGTVTGDSTYDYGTTATLIATPNTNYHFLNWTQNGNVVSTNPEFSFTVTQDSSFVANFVLDTYTISATVNPANSGTVSGDSTYDYGSTATLIATPNTGYHFVNWTQNGNVVSTNPEFSFTVTQDSSFVANFVLDTYTISASVNPVNSGTVSGDSTYDYSSTATLIATPNTGYHFVNWTQNGNEVSTDSIFTFTVTQDSSFVANFEANSNSVMENSNSNISIYPNPANDKVNIISDDIYEISLYDISGKLISTDNSKSRTKKLNVSSLKSGIYIIKLSNSESTYVYKIIKE